MCPPASGRRRLDRPDLASDQCSDCPEVSEKAKDASSLSRASLGVSLASRCPGSPSLGLQSVRYVSQSFTLPSDIGLTEAAKSTLASFIPCLTSNSKTTE